jgi:hypothetical protein
MKLSFTQRAKALFIGQYDDIRSKAIIGPEIFTTEAQYYTTYSSQVKAAIDKFLGIDKFGCQFVQSIVGFRANFIAGSGASITAKSENSPEAQWLQEFKDYNKLDQRLFEWVQYGELEGQVLFTFSVKDGNVKVNFIPYSHKNYSPVCDDNDYTLITEMQHQGKTWLKDKFVYYKLGGLAHYINNATNRLHVSLHDIEQIDRALNDWMKYRSKYGLGQLYFEAKIWEDASDLATEIRSKNWQPTTTISAPAKAYYVTPDGSALPIFENEIKTRVKKISGVTGVPPHFFGFTDLLANRSTSESLRDTVESTTAREINGWEWTVWQIVKQAMELHNTAKGTSLDPDSVEVTMMPVTDEQWNKLMNFYIPMNDLGFISDETITEMVPGIDAKREKSRLKNQPNETEKFKITDNLGGSDEG